MTTKLAQLQKDTENRDNSIIKKLEQLQKDTENRDNSIVKDMTAKLEQLQKIMYQLE